MALNNPTDPLVLNLDDVDAPSVDFYASLQNNFRTFREDIGILYQALWGQEATNFLLSGTGIHQMDGTWQPVRLLGQGGFGQVGLWERANDQTGEIEDEVAIKEMVRTAHPDVYLQRNPSLAREAVIMQQLNDVERRTNEGTNNNILRLRSFKNFPSAGRSRFYLEYAPYGDLYKLMYSYRAWDTYLPEEFLWHIFCSFANAAVLMETGPFTHLEDREPIQWSIIHFDIKPDNIFLGRRDERAMPADFPAIKVADFGLADLTGQDDHNNPSVFQGKGTPGYIPPVRIIPSNWHEGS
jgi:serine/threonine protein kinase